jgi:membrane dipeptidase
MWSRRGVIGLGAALTAAPLCARVPRQDWYKQALIIDGLAFSDDPAAPPGQTRLSEAAWAGLRETGVTAVNYTVAPPGGADNAWERLKEGVGQVNALIGANPDRLLRVEQVSDLGLAKRTGRIGIIFGTQDTDMVGVELARLTEMRKMGIRIVQLTYNSRNYAADGALEGNDGGLSRLGRRTIAGIEAAKLLLDLSHAGERTIWEGIAAATRPPAITHTGCKAIHDHPRNTSDKNLRALAEKGGVAGLYFISFLAPPTRFTTIDDVAAHLEHMKRVCGEDGIAIGSDSGLLPFQEGGTSIQEMVAWNKQRAEQGIAAPGEDSPYFRPFAQGLNTTDRLQRLAGLLHRRGWTTSQLEKLLGRNLERLFRETWS